jgi:hypothetical protein
MRQIKLGKQKKQAYIYPVIPVVPRASGGGLSIYIYIICVADWQGSPTEESCHTQFAKEISSLPVSCEYLEPLIGLRLTR